MTFSCLSSAPCATVTILLQDKGSSSPCKYCGKITPHINAIIHLALWSLLLAICNCIYWEKLEFFAVLDISRFARLYTVCDIPSFFSRLMILVLNMQLSSYASVSCAVFSDIMTHVIVVFSCSECRYNGCVMTNDFLLSVQAVSPVVIIMSDL